MIFSSVGIHKYMNKPREKRIIMARRVANEWLRRAIAPEYSFSVLYGAREIRNLPNLLRSMRDGKVAMEGVPLISDLGISEGFDSVILKSSNRDSMISLKNWLESRGIETTGLW